MYQKSTLADRIYDKSGQWGRSLEELATHPIQYIRQTYSHPEVQKDFYYTAGISTVTVPPYGAFETTVGGLTDLVSLKARGLGVLTTYFLLSHVLEAREELSKKWETEKKGPLNKWLFDAAYVGTIILGVKFAGYFISGEDHFGTIVLNTLVLTAAGAIFSRPLIKVMEAYSKLAGYRGKGWQPKVFENMSERSKKKLAIGWLAAGVAATILAYMAIPNKPDKPIVPETQVVEKLPNLESAIK